MILKTEILIIKRIESNKSIFQIMTTYGSPPIRRRFELGHKQSFESKKGGEVKKGRKIALM